MLDRVRIASEKLHTNRRCPRRVPRLADRATLTRFRHNVRPGVVRGTAQRHVRDLETPLTHRISGRPTPERDLAVGVGGPRLAARGGPRKVPSDRRSGDGSTAVVEDRHHGHSTNAVLADRFTRHHDALDVHHRTAARWEGRRIRDVGGRRAAGRVECRHAIVIGRRRTQPRIRVRFDIGSHGRERRECRTVRGALDVEAVLVRRVVDPAEIDGRTRNRGRHESTGRVRTLWTSAEAVVLGIRHRDVSIDREGGRTSTPDHVEPTHRTAILVAQDVAVQDRATVIGRAGGFGQVEANGHLRRDHVVVLARFEVVVIRQSLEVIDVQVEGVIDRTIDAPLLHLISRQPKRRNVRVEFAAVDRSRAHGDGLRVHVRDASQIAQIVRADRRPRGHSIRVVGMDRRVRSAVRVDGGHDVAVDAHPRISARPDREIRSRSAGDADAVAAQILRGDRAPNAVAGQQHHLALRTKFDRFRPRVAIGEEHAPMLPRIGWHADVSADQPVDGPGGRERTAHQDVAPRACRGRIQESQDDLALGHRGDVGRDAVVAVVDDQQPEHPTRHLQEGRTVMVRVVPEGAAHVVGRNVVDEVAAEAAFEGTCDVIARGHPRNMEPVRVQVADVRVFEDILLRAQRFIRQGIVKAQHVLVARSDFDGRTGDAVAASRLAVGPRRECLAANRKGGLSDLHDTAVVGLRVVWGRGVIGPQELFGIGDDVGAWARTCMGRRVCRSQNETGNDPCGREYR